MSSVHPSVWCGRHCDWSGIAALATACRIRIQKPWSKIGIP